MKPTVPVAAADDDRLVAAGVTAGAPHRDAGHELLVAVG